MGTLTKAELLKRNNIDIFIERIQSNIFIDQNKYGKIIEPTGRLHFVYSKSSDIVFNLNNPAVVESAKRYILDAIKRNDPKEKIMISTHDGLIPLNTIFKDREFGGRPQKASIEGTEAQEITLVSLIRGAIKRGKRVKISSFASEHVVDVEKVQGTNDYGKEPYADINIHTENKKWAVSCKMRKSVSVAGGGISGIASIDNQLLVKLRWTLLEYFKHELKLKHGQLIHSTEIPELFIEVPNKHIENILTGTKEMGGPVDMMFVGDKIVEGEYIEETNTLNIINGEFYTIPEYIKSVGSLYFRIRKRDLPADNIIQIDYETNTRSIDFPLFITTPGDNLKNHLRVVVTDRVPSNGKVLRIN